MRKLSLLVVALAFFVGTTANAATEPNESNPVTITQEIGKFLANPDFDFGSEEIAKASFMINKDNEVVVLSVDSDNDTVVSYIKSRLNYQKLEADAQTGMEYTVPVRLKTVV